MAAQVWNILSHEAKEPEGVMTDNFIMKFDRYLDWNILSSHYDFSIDMLRIYSHRVNWGKLLKRRKFAEKFLREMAPNFEEAWGVLSKYQTLSEGFIHDFANKVDWDSIALYQDVTGQFLDDHSDYFKE